MEQDLHALREETKRERVSREEVERAAREVAERLSREHEEERLSRERETQVQQKMKRRGLFGWISSQRDQGSELSA